MYILIVILHVIVCIALILIVLLQTGKGAEMGAAFGGASQTVFGGAGPAPFLTKITTGAAIFFMITSLTLAYLSAKPQGSSIMQEVKPVSAPQPVAPGALPSGSPPADAVPVAPEGEAQPMPITPSETQPAQTENVPAPAQNEAAPKQ